MLTLTLHPMRKVGRFVFALLSAIVAVLAFVHFSSAWAANVAQPVPFESIPEEVNVGVPVLGNWIMAANLVTSNLYIINDATGTVYGPFLEGQLGTPGGARLDIAITPDHRTALISNFGDSAIFFVDVTDPIHPTLITSVTVPMFAEDIDITPDGKFALVSDGGLSSEVASIDLLSHTFAYTINLGTRDAQAVEVAPNGTVILADYLGHSIHTLILDEFGAMTYANTYSNTYPGFAVTDTNGLPYPVNLGLAPDGQTVLVGSSMTSTVGVYKIIDVGVLTFTQWVKGLQGAIPGSDIYFPGVQSFAFNAAGNKAYAVVNNNYYTPTSSMTPTLHNDMLAILNIDGPGQVSLDAGGVVSIPHMTTGQFFGVDTLALAGGKLYFGYPTSSMNENISNIAVVDLRDFSVSTTLEMSSTLYIPAGLAVIPLEQVFLPIILR